MECQPACPVMKLGPTPQVCTPCDPQNHSHLSAIQHALKECWVTAQEEQTQYQKPAHTNPSARCSPTAHSDSLNTLH